METLVVVDQDKGRYNAKSRRHACSPSSSRVFREINCRSFQNGVGILPTPVKAWKPVGDYGKKLSPNCVKATVKTPECVKSVGEGKGSSKEVRSGLRKSSSVPSPISVRVNCDEKFLYCKKLSYNELWAGPAYSNSPPPSSLPMPRFSVTPKPKRSVSLELPCSEPEVDVHQVSRSAPPSPTKRDHVNSGRNVFHSADYASATKDLRRMLNLDMDD